MPPARDSDPANVSELPMAVTSNDSPSGRFSTVNNPGGPETTVPLTTLTPATAIAAAPAFRSSFSKSETALPAIGPLIVMRTP
jgi:hypothetical protein